MDTSKLSNKCNYKVMFSKDEKYFILTTQLTNYKYDIKYQWGKRAAKIQKLTKNCFENVRKSTSNKRMHSLCGNKGTGEKLMTHIKVAQLNKGHSAFKNSKDHRN